MAWLQGLFLQEDTGRRDPTDLAINVSILVFVRAVKGRCPGVVPAPDQARSSPESAPITSPSASICAPHGWAAPANSGRPGQLQFMHAQSIGRRSINKRLPQNICALDN